MTLNRATLTVWLAVGALGVAGIAGAQDLEPGVQTSPTAQPAPSSAPAAAPASAPAKTVAPTPKQAAVDKAAQGSSAPGSASTAGNKTAANAAPANAAPANVAKGNAKDKIELGTTEISGNRELPKVMYVVPWRRPDLGDMTGKPPNSLLDEALAPVDREVFRRQNSYYDELQSAAKADKTSPPGSSDTATPAGPKQ